MVEKLISNNSPGIDEFSLCFPSIAAYLDKDGIELLLNHLTQKNIAVGDTLIHYGELSNSLFMLLNGELKATLIKNKNSFELGRITSGKWVGEVSVIDPGPATATVSVTHGGSVLVLSHNDFEILKHKQPSISIAILSAISIDLANRMRWSVNTLLEGIVDDQGITKDSMTKATQNLVGIDG